MRRTNSISIAFSFTIMSLLSVFVVGCAVSSATLNSYTEPGFTPSSIAHIAVFPMRNVMVAPGQAEALDSAVVRAIKRRTPSIAIVTPSEVTNILNQKGLADKWARFLDSYETGGIPNASALKDIGKALGVDAIIQGEINNIQQINGSFMSNTGVTFVKVHYFMIDVQSSSLLWQASSNALRTTSTTVEAAPPIIQAIHLAEQKILSALPF